MTAPEVELRAVWTHLAGPSHVDALDHLLSRLREPHRHYHTATHVMWVLRNVTAITEADTLPPGLHMPEIRLAALFHDAVYDPRSADNEVHSADLAVRRAGELGWASPRCTLVRRLVMATAGHHPSGIDEVVLVDADLAILGAQPNDYSAYVLGVRAEYAHVDDEQWRAGRSQVLQRFLDTPQLFGTRWGSAREVKARANIAAELASLGG